jgi:hypothetical protein
MNMAFQRIDGFGNMKPSVQSLLTRNMHQVLGHDLKTPVEFVICWTPGGKDKGGTAYAIRLARDFAIPVFNLANEDEIEKLRNYLC